MTDSSIDRRYFLRAAGAAALSAAAVPLLGGCGDSSSDDTAGGPAAPSPGGSSGQSRSSAASPAGGSAQNLPTYTPWTPAQPDLPALDDGTPAAYYTYPASPKMVYSDTPDVGKSISVMKEGPTALPMPLSKNKYWQELNKRLGAALDITQISESDYASKLPTTLAGDDLPDLTQMPFTWPHLPDLAQAMFEDLSPWLAGDAIKDFPSLAAIPTYGWRNVAFNGGIWGIPYTWGSTAGSEVFTRRDIIDKAGFDGDLSDGNDFVALCEALTDVKRNQWAIADLNTTALAITSQMSGAPNQWKVEDGKFTREFETGEYKDALGRARQLFARGLVYPDVSATLQDGQRNLWSGKGVLLQQGYGNFASMISRGQAATPAYQQGVLKLPRWAGGGPADHYLTIGSWTFTAIKKSSPSRVRDLLTVLDRIAAPFGSAEYLFARYGIADHDYTLDGSDPVVTPAGQQEVGNMAVKFLVTAPDPLYMPGRPEATKAQHSALSALLASASPPPTAGLFSDTQLTVGVSIDKAITNVARDIMAGRKPLSSWAAAVRTWQSGGGNTIRAEYEDSYARNH